MSNVTEAAYTPNGDGTYDHALRPKWISHYVIDGEQVVPVARPVEYAGNASAQRERREHGGTK